MGLIKSNNVPVSASPFSIRDIETHAKGILLRARQQAEQLLAAAQAEGEQLKAQARAQGLEEGRRDGMAQGLQQGRQAGQQQALNEAKAQLQESVNALGQSLAMLDAHRADLEAIALQDVVKLSIAIAERVTKRQGQVDPQVMIANLEDAMKRVMQQSDLRVAIHPSQKKTLDESLPRLGLAFPALKHAQIIEDPGLAPGGCRIFTQHGQIDAGLDAQLERLANDLLPSAEEAGS